MRSKYRNKITQYLGIKFHSLKEARRYQQLLLLEKSGQIQNLSLQQRFTLSAHNSKICAYVADFTYIENGKPVIEDVKGKQTDVFKLKWKLLQAQEGNKYIYRLT